MRRKLSGLKPVTEAWEHDSNRVGRGAMYTGRSRSGSGGGLYRRENAGISSEREARNLSVESLRFPGEGSSAQGKSGPKLRPKGVDDGHQVEIPGPPKLGKMKQ